MSGGLKDVHIGYSPNNRATCDYCGRTISKGELRMQFKKPSDYHDTFDSKWNHAFCQLKRDFVPTALRGIEFLKYQDVLEISKLLPRFFPEIEKESKADQKTYLERSKAIWEYIDEFEEKIKPGQLKDLLTANGVPLERFELYDQLYVLTFGMYHGLLDPCPVCKMHLMFPFRDQVRCKGWMSHSKCGYEGKLSDYPNRFKLNHTIEVKNAFLKKWEHPDQKLYKTFKELADVSGGSGGSAEGGSLEASGSTSTDALKQESKKVEYVLPQEGNECAGMSVSFIGSGIPAEIKQLVETHGGTILKSITKNTTHVIVSDPETQANAKGVKDALAKAIPILPLKFLYDLVGYEEPANEKEPAATDPQPEPTSAVEETKPKGRGKKRGAAALEEEKPKEEVKEEKEVKKPKRGRGKAKAEEGEANEEEPREEKKKEPEAKKVEKGKEKEKEKKKPNVELRLPEKLKESGYLLYDSLPGEANLETVLNPFNGGEKGEKFVKLDKKPPKLGSEILKVHPDSGLTANGQILLSDDGLTSYNCMLNNVDLTSGKNRFYVIQIIAVGKSYNLFKKWGRTGGGTYDGSKVEKYTKKEEAVKAFEEKFFESTGNDWANVDFFKKKPNKYSLVKLDDGNDTVEDHELGDIEKKQKIQTENLTVSQSKLSPRQRQLCEVLFDLKQMEKALQSMSIDTKKMPLGKLSKSTILEAYKVLKEIEDLQKQPEDNIKKLRITDTSTRFYTLIPHFFPAGVIPPIIDKEEMLRDKVNMLDSLLDLEVAGKIMGKEVLPNKEGVVQDAMDARYDSLNAEITPLDKESETYQKIHQFTQGNDVKLEIFDIFEVNRKGENERFKPFETDKNRQLLWHGSRLTNWVGILSQGLRIAPPEAPVSGYLFGKGVYFANMIEKSSHYCRSDSKNPICLLSLSEVALGDMYEVTRPEYMEKAKPGYLSTKAKGRRYPDPKGDYHVGGPTGPVLPLGNILKNPNTTMGHDELIVYDSTQIRCRYLIFGKFLS